MAVDIKMPQLSDTMHSGKILSWKKREGDKITRGDILAEVETEKANLEIESFHQGTLLKILVPAQSNAGVGDVIAIIGEAGEAVNAAPAKSAPVAPPASPVAPTPAAPTQTYSPPPPQLHVVNADSGRVKASPLARKIASERNIDLSSVAGSGPEGRIVRKDVEGAQSTAPAQKSTPSTSTPAPRLSAVPNAAPTSGGRTYPMSKMRDLIGRRMQESMRESPHFYTTVKINMRNPRKLQATLKLQEEYKGLSLNHLIIKAAAYALQHEPRVNNAVRDGQVYEPAGINIGVITAIEDGLLIPVIKDANQLTLKDIVFEVRAAVERAKAGRPSSSDLTGGTFSISNMGMFDVENFTAIINPGQGAVLAVSSVVEEPVVEGGAVIAGETMKVTLSVDHRIIDGVMAATFLKHFKQALEMPALMLMA